jgi:hypothetical protein
VSEEAGLDIDFDAELAGIQGAVAGVAPPPTSAAVEVAGKVIADPRTIELKGKRFRVADSVGLMPLLKFSAFSDVDVQDPRALGALYAMLKDCIHPGNKGCGECTDCKEGSNRACPEFDPGDWHAFEDWACESKAEAEHLMDVVTKTIEIVSGRPTQPPSPSARGRRASRR